MQSCEYYNNSIINSNNKKFEFKELNELNDIKLKWEK